MDGELLIQHVPKPESLGHDLDLGGKEFRRTITVKDQTQVWKRFVVLPHVNGQIYTIGANSTNREEQGELIFLATEQLAKLKIIKGGVLCYILCWDGKYWLTPLEDNKIFVNGNKLSRDDMGMLMFGDMISFEEKDGNNDICEGLARLLFVERKFLPLKDIQNTLLNLYLNENEVLEQETPAALRNELILSKIASFLPFNQLKTCRLVSKLWNRSVTTILSKESIIKFEFSKLRWYGGAVGRRISFLTDAIDFKYYQFLSTIFFQYLTEFEEATLFPTNWKIIVPNFGLNAENQELDPSEGKPGWKWIQDLDWFLTSPKGHHIKVLHLHGEFNCAMAYESGIKILGTLQETLEELELSGLDEIAYSSCRFPATVNKLNKLKTFICSLSKGTNTFDDNTDNNRRGGTWLHGLIQAISGVKTLHLKLEGRENLSLTILENWNCFPNLENVSFDKTTENGMILLSKINKPLKRLKLRQLVDLNPENVHFLNNIINKQCKSLEALQFVLLPKKEWFEQAIIKFPSFFPNLHMKNLQVVESCKVSDFGVFELAAAIVEYELDGKMCPISGILID